MHKTIIVIPCFNEERRIDLINLKHLLEDQNIQLLFVDDGSTDGTAAVISEFCASHKEQTYFMSLAQNSGKGEAVRQGLLRALAEGGEVVGFLDADLATPAGEMRRLIETINHHLSHPDVLIGARVRLLGRQIERSAKRHFLGRIFATCSSLILDLQVYDTQCGAKLFRRNPSLFAALSQPFASRWIFDVELLGRLLIGRPGTPPLAREAFLEEPLQTWRDVKGSKLGPTAMLRAALDLLRVRRRLKAYARGQNIGATH